MWLPAPDSRLPTLEYAELEVTTNFTFLTGASHPEELVEKAAALGYRAISITDTNTLAGIVRAHVAARQTGIQLVVGCRLAITWDRPVGEARNTVDSKHEPFAVMVYPTDRAAYGRLCRLLTLGKQRAAKGQCRLYLHDLVEHHEGLLAVVVPPPVLDEDFIDALTGLKSVFDRDRLSIAVSRLYGSDQAVRCRQVSALAEYAGVPQVATNAVHYHEPRRRALQDVVTCIRLGCTLDEAGLELFVNAERYLKSPSEMARLFADCPGAIARGVEIVRRASAFNLDQLRYEYPREVRPGVTPMRHLAELTWQGAAKRYPKGIPEKVRGQLEHEFELIEQLQYALYFLTVHDLVVFARSQDILCQGRGAAANSAVCYCLGVTNVDPDRIDVLFERFVSRQRREPPDIDIDFEHERREEVIQYIYRKYGRDRAALTAEVITYRPRSAVREVGKVLGLSLDGVDRLAKNVDWWDKDRLDPGRLRELGFNPADPAIRCLGHLLGEILGFPRHLSQHVGGFVITQTPLCELVPIENAAMEQRTVIEWDKDDIDAMGMLKVDVLGLGMLTCIRKCLGLINADHETEAESPPPKNASLLQLHTIPPEDSRVYDMVCRADTVGVFQIESRAQMSMLPRLRPRCFYDLVIEVAIVRPGPIHGRMVHPYLRRRHGEEKVVYPSEAVRRVLGKTLGVPLFQEQAMQLAIVAAGFTPEEADQLRQAIAAWKSKKQAVMNFGDRLIHGMVRRGYPREFAQACFEQIKGFSEYGFPESHAASFALLVYVSAWLKCHHPAAFAAALINSQPMGFYAPAQIIRDAREHGVEVRSIDVNHSRWDCTLEVGDRSLQRRVCGVRPPRCALRLGMRLTKGLCRKHAQAVVDAVCCDGPFDSIEALWRASGAPPSTFKLLAGADAFESMGLDRQAALWQVRALSDEDLPMFESQRVDSRDGVEALPSVGQSRKVVQDYVAFGLSLRAHPMFFVRGKLDALGVIRAIALKDEKRWPHGCKVAVAGIVLVRQRPGTASGIIFMTLEDETSVSNLVVRPHIFQRYRQVARHGVAVLARGRVERSGMVVHVVVNRIEDISHDLASLATRSRDFH